jgi:apolipoprotein N-acyltransferase
VSLATALTGGWLALLIGARDARMRALWTTLLLVLWGAAALLNTVSWTRPAGAPLRATLLQGDIPQDVKWLAESLDPTLELYTKLTEQHWDSQLIVWPESAVPEMYHDAKDFIDVMAKKAESHHADILIGVLYDDPATGRYYNSIVSVGGRREFYYKHHLVPFTEYLPMQSVLGGIVNFMQVPMSDFSKGATRQPPLAVAGQQAGISICYEDAFGEEAINALPEATFLVNVSDDAWFGHSIAPQQHLQIARMRALETGRPLLRDTNTGLTAIVDDRGKLQAVAPQFKVAALTGEIQPMRGMTPYARVGNALVVVLIAAMTAAAAMIARRRRRP